jgi:hypothetical protein
MGALFNIRINGTFANGTIAGYLPGNFPIGRQNHAIMSNNTGAKGVISFGEFGSVIGTTGNPFVISIDGAANGSAHIIEFDRVVAMK